MDFVSQQHWDDSYRDYVYSVPHDEVTAWLDNANNKLGMKGSLFEFGCYPGRYLAYMGKKGWTVNGMDLTPGIAGSRFFEWLHKQGVKTNFLCQGDALKYAAETSDRYDVVCSFGFIEHFENFLHMIELHDHLLKEKGWLIITTPNFKGGLQKFLHTNLNRDALGLHYLPSMQPSLWKKKLEDLGYKVEWSGYFGGFSFWSEEAKRSALQKLSLKIIRKFTPLLKRLPDRPSYSPYCGIIAQKLVK